MSELSIISDREKNMFNSVIKISLSINENACKSFLYHLKVAIFSIFSVFFSRKSVCSRKMSFKFKMFFYLENYNITLLLSQTLVNFRNFLWPFSLGIYGVIGYSIFIILNTWLVYSNILNCLFKMFNCNLDFYGIWLNHL